MAFNFESSYANLGENFYSFIEPESIENPKMLLLNEQLLKDLNIQNSDNLISYLCANKLSQKPLAMAYAGHQFGYFTMLGDGRAMLLGDHITNEGKRFDIALKGSGITPYSRGGDGKASASSMIREYIYCYALNNLGVKSSQALAVILTGKKVFRQKIEPGALLVRVMQSHVRIGTFEYASNYLQKSELKRLLDYVIEHYYRSILDLSGELYLNFFESVMESLICMVVSWFRVGFVHGVMNTDNMSITSETFDYGPCAFMNYYDLNTLFSSIDRTSRYSYGNQKPILYWNLTRFAEAISPIVEANSQNGMNKLNQILSSFDELFEKKFNQMMHNKLGFEGAESNSEIVDEFLKWLEDSKADYTNTFLALIDEYEDEIYRDIKFLDIKKRLSKVALKEEIMTKHNPYFIPRNYIVEEAIDEYEKSGSLKKVDRLLEVMKNPYQNILEYREYQKPPLLEYDRSYTTFCNT